MQPSNKHFGRVHIEFTAPLKHVCPPWDHVSPATCGFLYELGSKVSVLVESGHRLWNEETVP